MKYRADIDGLRAVAVISVLLFHGGAKEICSGGYVGVDIFFVISGYVITITLNNDLQSGHYSLWRFYSKRIRRIFPALFFTILVVAIAGWFILLPYFFRDFFKSVMAVSTFVSNIYFWKNSGYFAAKAISQPLLHTWSLAVEEQYYLFIPLIMYIVFKYFKGRQFVFFLPIALISFIASCYAIKVAPTANFLLLPTRTWELLVGTLLAVKPTGLMCSRWINEILAIAGLGLIGYAVFSFSDATAFPGFNALYPCLGAALLIYANENSSTTVGKILSSRSAVGIGKISYSLYLIHWPIVVFFYFVMLSPPTLKQLAPIAGVSLVLAFLSWKYVEQPFRHLEGEIMQRRLLAGGVAFIGIFYLLGWVGTKQDGFPHRFPDYAEQKIEGKEQWNLGTCFFDGNVDPARWSYDKCQIISGKKKTVLLWGDSFAAQYVPGLVRHKDDSDFNVVQYTAAGCPPVLSYRSYARPWCTDFNANALDIIRKHNIDVVVLSALWTDMESRGLEQIRSTLDALDKIGVKTYIIGQSPAFSVDVQVLAFSKGDRSKNSIDSWKVFFDPEINKVLERADGNHSFIDPVSILCNEGLCPYRDHGVFLYSDYGHFSPEGSARAVKKYFPLFNDDSIGKPAAN